MKKFFILSDEHGNFKAIQEALWEAEYDENNPEHFLVSAGDCFDRGDDSAEIYMYYKRLCDEGKMIALEGNHNEFLADFLACRNYRKCYFNYVNNGLRYTIDSFLGQTCAWDMYVMYHTVEGEEYSNEKMWKLWEEFVQYASKEINCTYAELFWWVSSRPKYLELKNSIITHGMIDCSGGDWKNPALGWKKCEWASPEEAASMENNTGKHIYVGHINADMIREYYGEKPQNNDTYTRPSGDVTYLDACTILTGKVNIVCIEDDFEEEG